MAIARAQASATATSVSGATATTGALGSATTAGNILIATGGGFSGTSGDVSATFSDNKGNNWTTLGLIQSALNSSSNSVTVAIGAAYLANVGTGHTVTLTTSGAGGAVTTACNATEFSGLALALDGVDFAQNVGPTTSLSGSGIVTVNAADLLVSVFSIDNDTSSSGQASPLSLNGSTSGVNVIQSITATTTLAIEASYSIVSAAGTYTWSETFKSDATSSEAILAIAFSAQTTQTPQLYYDRDPRRRSRDGGRNWGLTSPEWW